jgi:hypothetical protein
MGSISRSNEQGWKRWAKPTLLSRYQINLACNFLSMHVRGRSVFSLACSASISSSNSVNFSA